MTDKERAEFWEKQFKDLEKKHIEQRIELNTHKKQLIQIKRIASI